MRLSTRIKVALALWFAGEAIVFILVAKLIGFAAAVLIAFITSLFGWTLLKRTGAAAMVKLRALVEGRVAEPEARHFLDEGLSTLGALALLMPGFLSDLVGLILAVPLARKTLSRWIGTRRIAQFGARRGRTGPSTIDLEPGDWQRSDPTRRPITKL